MFKKTVRKPFSPNTIKSLVALFQRLIERYGIEERAYVKADRRGIVLIVSEAILSRPETAPSTPPPKPGAVTAKPKPNPERPIFEPGTADLKPETKRILENILRFIRSDGIIELTRDPEFPVRVEVHTDTVPIENPQFPSNRELSSARADSIVRYLVTPDTEEEEGLPATRFTAFGGGESRPITANDTQEGRAKNRRIEIIVLNYQEEAPAKRSEEWLEVNPSGWLLTFGDLTNLLLTFFIFLFAASSKDSAKLQEVLYQFKKVPQKEERLLEVKRVREKEAAFTPEEIRKILEDKGIQDKVTVREDKRGLILSVSDAILFDSGTAELKAAAAQVLQGVIEIFTETDYLIRVEGHTDNVRIISPRYQTNWELSNGRAAVVARHFIDLHKIEPKRFSVAGYGEFRPVSSNATEEGKAKNRRVEIVILNKKGGKTKQALQTPTFVPKNSPRQTPARSAPRETFPAPETTSPDAVPEQEPTPTTEG